MGYVEIVRPDGTVTTLGDKPNDVLTDVCDKCDTRQPKEGGYTVYADELDLLWICYKCRVAHRGKS